MAERLKEQRHLVGIAQGYVDALASEVNVLAAVVAGSVARGDFNVWSDIDVVLIVDELPGRIPDRQLLLMRSAPARVQPVAYTPAEFERAVKKGNRLLSEARRSGIPLKGELPSNQP